MIDGREDEIKKRLKRFSLNPQVPLPPRNPESRVRRNYLNLFQLKMPEAYGGIGVDRLFFDRHLPHDGQVHTDKLTLVSNTSLDLPSFLDIGIGTLPENSPLNEKISKANQKIIMWLDEWVAPKDSPNTDRDKPIYQQVSERVLKESEKMEPYEKRSKFLRDWWENLTLLRFLMAKGSAGSIMLNRQNGVDTSTLNADLFTIIGTQDVTNDKLLTRIVKLFQGPDLDFAVFPTDVYQEVFTEFQERGILSKSLGKEIIRRNDLIDDEVEKYEVAKINEGDIRLPPGFKLKTNKLFCAFSAGKIKQKASIPYYDIVYYTKIENTSTGQTLDYKVSALEFIPSTVDESTVDEDSRTGASASLLSQMRAAGIFLVNNKKRFPPTWLEAKDQQTAEETGFVVKLDSSFAEAMTLPDFPVGRHLNNMINGEIDLDHSFIATLLGRSLRDGLFNSLNIMSKDKYSNHPFSGKYEQTFWKLSEKFKPELVNDQNKAEMELGLTQAWILDFPLLINFLNNTGFAKYLVMGQNDQVLQAMTDIARNIERSSYYESFLTKLVKTKEQSKEGKPAKIDEVNLQQMVKQNFTKVAQAIRSDNRIPNFFKEGKSDFELLSELISMPIFRELPKEQAWGAELAVNIIDSHNIRPASLKVSSVLQIPIFGYRFYESGNKVTYHMSRYPRTLKYNIGTPEQYEMAIAQMSSILGIKEITKNKSIQKESRFRIVLGLNEGYSNKKVVPFEEMKEFLGNEFVCRRGKVISANSLMDNFVYEEDVTIIEGNIENINKVFQAADLTGQERFAVELLDKQEAFIVETRHCGYSDLEFKKSAVENVPVSVVSQT